MEVLIFGLIAFIISAISKRNTPADGGGKTKPFMQKPVDQRSMKKIEDYAKEVFGDVQKQMGEKQSRTQVAPEVKKRSEPVRTFSPVKGQVNDVQQRSANRPGRLSAHNATPLKRVTTPTPSSLVPKTENEILQAIIFSEILAPPKSKR